MTPRAKNILTFILIWVIASTLAISLRLYTLINHVPHEVDEKATFLVIKNMRSDISHSIETSYPTLSLVEKQKMAKQQFDLILHRDREKVRETIDQVARGIQDKSPSSENPFYLAEADSYYYYNLTENILNTGRISDKIQGSKYLNTLMNAPHGFWEPLNLHPYIGVFVYKIVSLFKPGVPLMEAVSYTPLFMVVLIIFAFLVGCSLLECSPWVSLLGGIYLICVPVFLRRSMFGWYKNDPTNIFFLFLIPALLFYGLKNLTDRKAVIKAAVVCGVTLSLYSLFWQGWVFLASLIAVSGALILLWSLFLPSRKQLAANVFFYFLILISAAFIMVSLIFGPKEFFVLFQEGWKALQDFINPQLSLWPDLYIAVGELLSPTPGQWLDMMGGLFFVGIGMLGLGWRAVTIFRDPQNKNNASTIFLLIFWLITFKLSFGAQRFGTLGLIPFALAFTLGVQFIYEISKKYLFKFLPTLKDSLFTQGFIMACALTLLAIPPLQSARKKTPEVLNQIYNSTWDKALLKIKNDTPPDSIINTWWPPGHFIKAIAQRRVTFDGATINQPQSYWLANAFLATNEKASAGILRMLNTSGNDATNYLVGQGYSLTKATNLLKKILVLDEKQAREALGKILKEPTQVDHLLSLTHAKAPPSYLLIYKDMAEESLQFSFVAKWNFSTVEKINHDPELLKSVPHRNSKDYIPYLWKIAGGAPRYTPILTPVAEKGPAIIFENNILVDRSLMNCEINSPKYGSGIPRSILYVQNGEYFEKILPKASLPISTLLINDKSGPLCMLADTALAHSVLFRLYFFGGKGLEIFEPFIDEQDSTGRTRIVVYRVNWDKLK